MTVLNLGCGAKTSDSDNVVNIDWSVALRLKRHPLRQLLVPVLMRGERRQRFDSLPENILVHNLARGIPFSDESVDAVYHSHMLEHLDRNVAPHFLQEVRRVLRPGGVQRIVVPDLEVLCRAYVAHLDASLAQPGHCDTHDDYVADLLEQSVRREASGTSQQSALRRRLENLVLGDARRRGETHQWMYDRVNLPALLSRVGFRDISVVDYSTSRIPDWSSYGLDCDAAGGEYRPGSQYIEAIK